VVTNSMWPFRTLLLRNAVLLTVQVRSNVTMERQWVLAVAECGTIRVNSDDLR